MADIFDEIADERGLAIEPLDMKMLKEKVKSINTFKYVPEEQNEDILIKGRWLERGGSAWWISTAGTGKSIACVQLAFKWGAGLDFAGLEPRVNRPLVSWIIQSEDSPSRIAIDRLDILAELKEQTPEVDWEAVGERCVKFVNVRGNVGTAFIKELDGMLALAEKCGEKPDVVIINPFMAFVGGPVSDSGYVTPFLRGGEVNHEKTIGLQSVLEKHWVAALIFHHTPKPPTDKEIDAWLKSPFPEYQGAGSSDITNWGRSFITMMKVPSNPQVVCMNAGKNGSEIGWEVIGNSRRRYMAWSKGEGVAGGYRHAWRNLDEQEYDDIVGKAKGVAERQCEDVAVELAEELKKNPCKLSGIEAEYGHRWKRPALRAAIKMISDAPQKYHITIVNKLIGNSWTKFMGLADAARQAADNALVAWRIKQEKDGGGNG